MKKESVIEVFKALGGVLTTKELDANGVSYYHIKQLLVAGDIERIKQGVYRLREMTNDEMIEVQKLIPHGVFCMYSAALLHDLTTFTPSEYHVAIPHKSKVTLPAYPPIKIYYWDGSLYSLGQEERNINEIPIRVFDVEKTICDIVKFRSKTGEDMAKEVLKEYLMIKSKNLNKLLAYSKKLKIYTVLKNYVSILT
ncbi:MAG: type IV toxin-antitoxin system AbiEi family antitoxin domain-containing protein [Saprospiraceae bacterium]|nr:type IV toxin-antitoxin system AbiEi family antitoxin domain-containing protein [Saprospiraceae bacterium]